MDDFELGINYWPRDKAMDWWKEFDGDEVDRDFQNIEEMGFDSVRIFLMWEDFQPEPHRVSGDALDHLGTVLDVAGRYGLKVVPTFFTGHMSGINWVPDWALIDEERTDDEAAREHGQISRGDYTNLRKRDIYTDPLMIDAERFLIKEVVSRYHDHPALGGWDISNGCGHYCGTDNATEREWNKLHSVLPRPLRRDLLIGHSGAVPCARSQTLMV